jgi:hypothetical protein
MSYLRYLCLFGGGIMSYLRYLCLFVGVFMSYLRYLCLFVGGIMSYLRGQHTKSEKDEQREPYKTLFRFNSDHLRQTTTTWSCDVNVNT